MFGTLFDKSKRDKEPKGAQGDIDLHNNTGHSTQYYDDKKRVSWDQPGDANEHWINEDEEKGSNDRYTPPEDVKTK